MIPGFGGHLVSECFLERRIDADPIAIRTGAEARRTLGAWRRRTGLLGPASGLRTLLETGAAPLIRALGLGPPTGAELDRDAITATVPADRQSMGLVVAPWGARLDPLWRTAVVSTRARGAAWCLLFNGTTLRVLSAQRLYARRHADIDLDLAADDDRTAAALLMLVRGEGLDDLVAASDRDAGAVCRSLRTGVLEASGRILAALVRGRPRPPLERAFEQALTIVYRILFLLFAEARRLVPLWHPVYRDSYSLDVLADAVTRGGSPVGLWDALRAVSRLAHAGCAAGDLRVNAFNGRLFAPTHTPLVDRRDLDDEAAKRALVSMTTRPATDGAGRQRIAYRDLGVEELGGVYETLLDYAPAAEGVTSRAAPAVSLVSGSGLRKATGTFYTPQPIARYLVRRTLDPLLRDASPERILALRVLDPSMGSGAFLVAACEHLAQAYEAALIRQGGCHAHDLGPRERGAIRRTIAERCLFGVDVNPMAVQLARLSLWLATLAADRPLSFLDHHLQTGDSLVGAWLASLRRPPTGRPTARRRARSAIPLFQDEPAVGDAMRQALPVRFSLAETPNDTLAAVHAKERALTALNAADAPLSQWKRVADLWCAAWFAGHDAAPSTAFADLSEALLSGRCALPPATAARYLQRARDVAAERRFFHWELEFPEAFFDRTGAPRAAAGFDAVLGNPPWDMIRADAGPPDRRARVRHDAGALVRFARDSGVYSASSSGHANRYQLFVERAIALARRGGRIGLVVPWGLAADHGSAPLRRLLFSRTSVDACVGLDNRDGVFPIHRSTKFLLLTATAGDSTKQIACRLGERDPAALDSGGDEHSVGWFPVRMTLPLLDRLSGEDLSVPDLRSPLDLTIAERVASLFPSLGSAHGWGARFGRELNATDDRSVLRTDGKGLPVVEGKHLDAFRPSLADTRWTIDLRDADRLPATRHRCRRLAYRDVASATNRMTLIAAMLPRACVSTHTVFCLRTALPAAAQYFLCGLFNSFVLNYFVRLRVATHVTTAIVERLPVPCTDRGPAFRDISARARLLCRRHDPAALAELNGAVARLYELSADEFGHVLDTFPLVARADRDAALRAFRTMA